MPAIEIPAEIESRILDFAERTGEGTDAVVRDAILTYLEDREDAIIAAERAKNVGSTISLEEIGRKYGLAD